MVVNAEKMKVRKLFWRRSYFTYSVWLLLFLQILCSLKVVADIVRHDYWYEAEFSIINNGRHFDEVIMGVDKISLKECQHECVKHLKCKTVNYNENERKCELCDGDFDEDEALVGEMPDWKNYGTPPKQDGGYSDWIHGECNVTCGHGQRIRYRRCNKPHPKHGGADCDGPYLETLSCNVKGCPVDGGYGPWGNFTSCSKSCDNGTKSRFRRCDSPSPSNGGRNCTFLGVSNETKACFITSCKVDGGYSTWGAFEGCSKPCGGGIKIKRRTCTNPIPKHGGKNCSDLGNSSESMVCNTHDCPVTLVKSGITMGKTSYGDWSKQALCPYGIHVRGFRLQIEKVQGFKDDTALNGIQLMCADGNVTIELKGPFGTWKNFVTCENGSYVTGFNFRSEENQRWPGDDTGGVNVKMNCNDNGEIDGGGHDKWGSWDSLTFQQCPSSTYFCGVQALIEPDRGYPRDDSGMTKIKFLCCTKVVVCNEDNIKYSMNSISLYGDVPGIKSWQHCSLLCSETSECKVWTWKKDPAKICHLKTSDASKVNDNQYISGQKGCAIGNWGSWSTPSACSQSCDGIQKKSRTCETGHYCKKQDGQNVAQSEEITVICNPCTNLVCMMQQGNHLPSSAYSKHAGDGISDQDCINKCKILKETYHLINGVTISIKHKRCYCVMEMTGIITNSKHRTCFLREIVPGSNGPQCVDKLSSTTCTSSTINCTEMTTRENCQKSCGSCGRGVCEDINGVACFKGFGDPGYCSANHLTCRKTCMKCAPGGQWFTD